MLTSMMFAPPSTCCAGDRDRFFEVAVLDQPGELLRAGDVGPLADHDEVAVGAERERLACR